jgi:AAA ATPase domain
MKLTFTNLGALDCGELQIADLTIICGENNTGKTYVTYLVYCLLSSWKSLVDIDLTRDFAELRKSGTVRIDLQTKVADRWIEICSEAVIGFKNNFPEMLASKSDLFAKLDVQIDIPLGTVWKSREYKRELRSAKGNLLVSLVKAADSSILELAAPSTEGENIELLSLANFIEDRVFDLMLDEVIPNVFIASTERTGATTFKKQLNLAVGNILDLLTQAHKEGESSLKPQTIFDTLYGKPDYALPVRHNVQFLNALPETNAEDGSLHKEFPKLLERFENIVGGTYVTKNGATSFKPKGSGVALGLGESSSSVRSLLIVWYWLKYVAKKGDMLILDEPELNLHPANQRRLARFIASLVNHGVKVFLTTHSDYIVRELNTLIMLKNSENSRTVLKKFSEYLQDDVLDSSRLNLYMAQEASILKEGNQRKTRAKTLIKAVVSESLGVEAKSFDDTIDQMNAIQEAIYYGSE